MGSFLLLEVLRPGAAHGYCVGLITPASLAGAVYSQLAVRSTPAKLAGPIAVRSTPASLAEHLPGLPRTHECRQHAAG